MDVVFIYRRKKGQTDNLLRLSVRNICYYGLDIDNLYIIGEKPDGLKDYTHIYAPDPHKEKWKNAYDKTLIACNNPDISKDFLLTNDDFFATEHFEAETLPFYAIKGADGGNSGRYSFKHHSPIRINKEMYAKLPIDTKQKGDLSLRTFYCNFYGCPPFFVDEVALRVGDGVKSFDKQIKDAPFFTVPDGSAVSKQFLAWIDERQPEKCRYEE